MGTMIAVAIVLILIAIAVITAIRIQVSQGSKGKKFQWPEIPWKVIGFVAGGLALVAVLIAFVAGWIPFPNLALWRGILSFLLVVLAIAWWGLAKEWRWVSIIAVLVALVVGGPLWYANIRPVFTRAPCVDKEIEATEPGGEWIDEITDVWPGEYTRWLIPPGHADVFFLPQGKAWCDDGSGNPPTLEGPNEDMKQIGTVKKKKAAAVRYKAFAEKTTVIMRYRYR